MNSTTRVFQLIHSLNQKEKSAIEKELASGRKGKKSLYLRLFLAIAAQSEYDEAALKSTFAGTSFGKSLAFPKSHLYELLLQVLRQLRGEESIQAQFRVDLEKVEMLSERGFPGQALRILKKSLARAQEMEESMQVIRLLRQERRLVMRIQGLAFTAELARITEMEAKWEAVFHWEQVATRLHDELYAAFQEVRRKASGPDSKRIAAVQKELSALLQQPHLSFSAQVAAHRALAHSHHMANDFKAVHEAYHAEIGIWERHPVQIQADPLRYVRTFGQWLTSKALIGDYENLLKEIERLRIMRDLGLRGKAEVFQISYNLELYYYINSGHPKGALPLLPDIADGLETYRDYLLPSAKLGYFYNIALVYWMAGLSAKALPWVRRILQFEKSEVRLDIRSFAPLFEKVLHYELGHTGMLESWFRSFQYRKRRNGTDENMEPILMDLIRGLLSEPNVQVQRKLFQSFDEALQAHSRRKGVSQLGILELRQWAKGKNEGL